MAVRISAIPVSAVNPLPANFVPTVAAQAALTRQGQVSYINGVNIKEQPRPRLNGLGGLGELVQVVT